MKFFFKLTIISFFLLTNTNSIEIKINNLGDLKKLGDAVIKDLSKEKEKEQPKKETSIEIRDEKKEDTQQDKVETPKEEEKKVKKENTTKVNEKSFLSGHENKFLCNNEVVQKYNITFYNIQFESNFTEVFCQTIKSIKPDQHLFYLFPYSTGYTISNDGVGEYVVKTDLKKLNNANLVAEALYYNFCSIKKEELQYYDVDPSSNQPFNRLKDLSKDDKYSNTVLKNITLPIISPYTMKIHPIYIENIKFTLLYEFAFSAGSLITEEYDLNNKTISLNICKEMYDGSGFREVLFPMKLKSIQLISNDILDPNISIDIFNKIVILLKEKYSVKKNLGGNLPLHPSTCTQEYGAEDQNSSIRISYCDTNSNSIFITYSSKEFGTGVGDTMISDDARFQNYMKIAKENMLNNNSEKNNNKGL